MEEKYYTTKGEFVKSLDKFSDDTPILASNLTETIKCVVNINNLEDFEIKTSEDKQVYKGDVLFLVTTLVDSRTGKEIKIEDEMLPPEDEAIDLPDLPDIPDLPVEP